MQICTKCGVNQPLTQFHKDSRRHNGRRSSCKACYSAFHAKYYQDNTEKVKLRNKTIWVKRKYGFSLNELAKIRDNQQNKCAICEEELKAGSDVHVDHDHKTGKVRGILCRWCNTGLGQFKDSEKSLIKAVQYLQQCKKDH